MGLDRQCFVCLGIMVRENAIEKALNKRQEGVVYNEKPQFDPNTGKPIKPLKTIKDHGYTLITVDGKDIKLEDDEQHVATFINEKGLEIHIEYTNVNSDRHVFFFLNGKMVVDEHDNEYKSIPIPNTGDMEKLSKMVERLNGLGIKNSGIKIHALYEVW